MTINKRRAGVLVGGVGAVAALAALTVGGTSALYTSTVGPQQNSIQSGTNVLTENSAVTQTLTEVGFMPGDEKTSKYGLKYQGQDAFVGFDIKIVSTAQAACAAVANDASVTVAEMTASCPGVGAQPMFNGDTNSGSLDLNITPINGNTYGPLLLADTLQTATACAADGAGLITCTVEKKNVLVPPGYVSANSANDLIWTNNKTDSVLVTSKLPLQASNVFQGSTVKIDVVAHAVQAANNSGLIATLATGTTPTYGLYGTGNQATLLFPKSWS
jgi:hypothetical protein